MLNLDQIAAKVLNPATGKTFKDENRIKSAQMVGENFVIEYQRDGISATQKREIEDHILGLLKDHVAPEKIIVKTISQMASPGETPAQAKPQAQSAQLKTGHGPAGAQKKRVPNVGKVLAVASGKGGVGKSTVSVNLALTLTRLGHKVGLLDADIYGPSIPMLLGKRDAKPRANDDKKIQPEVAHGLKFMSFGLFIKEEDPVIWRGPMLGGVLNQFLFDVDWGELDYLIIDLPPGTGDMQLSMVQATEVDGAVIVTSPQDVAVLDAGKGLKMFEQVKVPVLGVIENMAGFICDSCDKVHDIFGTGGGENLATRLGVKYLGGIPLEKALRVGSDTGVPYMSVDSNRNRPAWKSYEGIAQTVAPSNVTPEKDKGLLGRLFSR